MSRRYVETDPVARALNIIGERWTLLIVRQMLRERSCRFHDFQTSLPGIAPNTLSARLKALEASGILQTRLYNEHPPRLEYSLTEKGRSLESVVNALAEWGADGR